MASIARHHVSHKLKIGSHGAIHKCNQTLQLSKFPLKLKIRAHGAPHKHTNTRQSGQPQNKSKCNKTLHHVGCNFHRFPQAENGSHTQTRHDTATNTIIKLNSTAQSTAPVNPRNVNSGMRDPAKHCEWFVVVCGVLNKQKSKDMASKVLPREYLSLFCCTVLPV